MSKPTQEEKVAVLKRIARAAAVSGDSGLLSTTMCELSEYGVTSWKPDECGVVASPRFPAIVVKEFRDLDGNWSTHQRRVSFPIPPFTGMGIVFNRDVDPLKVEFVFVNSNGDVVVCIENDDWQHEKDNFDGEWESQREYQLDGWEQITNNNVGIFKLY